MQTPNSVVEAEMAKRFTGWPIIGNTGTCKVITHGPEGDNYCFTVTKNPQYASKAINVQHGAEWLVRSIGYTEKATYTLQDQSVRITVNAKTMATHLGITSQYETSAKAQSSEATNLRARGGVCQRTRFPIGAC